MTGGENISSCNETKRCRVHAIAKMRGLGAIVKDVAEMGVAFSAGDCGADDAEGSVADLGHVFGGDRSPETGPSRPRVELGGGIEQRVVTTNAAIDARVVQVPVFSGEGDFGIGVARDVEDSVGKLLAPLRRGLDYFGDASWLQAVARAGKKHDGDFPGRAIRSGCGLQDGRLSPLPEDQACKSGCRSCEKGAALNVRWR